MPRTRCDDFLFSATGKEYLKKEYTDNKKSTHEIAKEQKTYHVKVLRALHAHGIPTRSQAEAQSVALSTGRQKHPTKGVGHSEETKNTIRQKLKEYHASER